MYSVRGRQGFRPKGRFEAKSRRKGRAFQLGIATCFSQAPKNKKEVKTGSFSPPGVGGVLLDNTLGGSAGLPCQAGLRPHSRTAFLQFVRRLTTKELVFLRFVAPRNARVNGKNKEIGSGGTKG